MIVPPEFYHDIILLCVYHIIKIDGVFICNYNDMSFVIGNIDNKRCMLISMRKGYAGMK